MNTPMLTVDGPVGAGKGAISQRVARHLGWHLLDSGALYRLLALDAARAGGSMDDEATLASRAHELDVVFQGAEDGDSVRVLLGGNDVSLEIREEECGNNASCVAALPAVRHALLDRQRAFLRPPGLVADGRDMGTVVFPDATAKIFLTASAEERAQRRHKQLMQKGIGVSLRDLLRDIEARDSRDKERAASPLVPAEDAVIIDTTGVEIDAVVNRVLEVVGARGVLVEEGSIPVVD